MESFALILMTMGAILLGIALTAAILGCAFLAVLGLYEKKFGVALLMSGACGVLLVMGGLLLEMAVTYN